MGTTTLLALEQLLSQAIGDYLSFEAAGLSTKSTAWIYASTLANRSDGIADYFNTYWLYFTEGNNSGKLRKVKDYLSTSTGAGTTGPTVKLYGRPLTSSTGSASFTCSLHKFNRDNKILAIKRAIDQIYPNLYVPVEDDTLITGNMLPDAHFEWWTSTSAMKFYSTSNATLTQTSTAGLTWGGKYSMKVAASAADGYAYISSKTYPRLLDLMGKTVHLYCMAYPEAANDAFLTIYTVSNDGTTTQTLNSTTTTAATYWTELKLEDQTLDDDLVEIQIRFRTHTNAKYVIFDNAMLQGVNLFEYLLPEQFQVDGNVDKVRIQQSGYTDQIVYDMKPIEWGTKLGFSTFTEDVVGTNYKFIRLMDYPSAQHRLKLEGIKKLETPASDSGTITLDGIRLNLLIAYAAHLLYEMEKGAVTVDDRGSYERESAYWLAKYRTLLPSAMMMRPSGTVKTGVS